MFRLSRFSVSLAVLISATLVSCLPVEQGAQTGPSSLSQSSQGGFGTNQSIAAGEWSLPSVVYPEQENLRVERHLGVLNSAGRMTWQHEALHADGAGEFRLDLLGVALDNPMGFSLPSDIQFAAFDRRQRYLVSFRDLHFGNSLRVRQNYEWHEEFGVPTVAGVLCDRYSATSRFGFGAVEFVIAADTRLLMGWSLRDTEGQITMTSTTVSLDWAPDHTGIAWSTPAAPNQAYTGSAADIATLGFEPTPARYIPQGFATSEERMVLVETIFPDILNLHLDVLDDGLRTLFFAQQRNITRGGGPGQSTGTGQLAGARYSDLGGIRVVEGLFDGREIFIVAPLPTDELMAMLGSLFD